MFQGWLVMMNALSAQELKEEKAPQRENAFEQGTR